MQALAITVSAKLFAILLAVLVVVACYFTCWNDL